MAFNTFHLMEICEERILRAGLPLVKVLIRCVGENYWSDSMAYQVRSMQVFEGQY